ncbi:hypothetical protein BCR34DRAFT_484631 [Clohesyomyces aquaticus]|uniref:Short-chain dehydrogenases/reductase n=1 Tax=Clohesyomyces aquaticus TaxID=1231657 RepID=A0A1Y1ZLK4_9PLEO|nr:hypothetical protein BCR34DRAFT_484631 [Clohesyomyces aquaticus]
MVSLPDVVASNARIPTTLPRNLVVVFAGATTGIGEATLKAFVKYAVAPRIYFLARSPESANRVAEECKLTNPQANFTIIKVDLSTVMQTDRACDEIKAKEKHVNLVVTSAGEVRLDLSPEGLHIALAAAFYTRIRIAQNLLPLLVAASKSSTLARVVNVAGGTKEGQIFTDDLPGLKRPLYRIRGHIISMTTLAMETLSEQAPGVAFVHDYPGTVMTPLVDGVPGWVGICLRLVAFILGGLLARWVCVPIEECGERHVFLGTSAKYPPKQGAAVGVPTLGDVKATNGVDGAKNSGMYSVAWDCEDREKVVEILDGLRKKGTKELVWDHVNGEFERIKAGKGVDE